MSGKDGFGSVPAVFHAAVAADPTRPLLTFYDDATGERTELSGTTLANWVAKTANLLVDGCGLGPGDHAGVALPPHWQTAAVLLGAWSAGLAVTYAGPVPGGAVGSAPGGAVGSALVGAVGPGLVGALEPAEVSFVTVDRLDRAPSGERFVLGLAPMGLPLREVPAGFVDYVAEVRGHGDHFRPYAPVRESDPATGDGTTHGELCRAARESAARRGLGPTDRVLVDAAQAIDPSTWLLVPLAAGASVVLCANTDPAALERRRESERITHVLAP
ncbi:TIGR03089 family protein [Planosporangium sp. 12N6]|uniref:TIGR03089 family protein n=1 Tax=Planosporangium spinosum TaxID=3402278 RepID=UPI003CE8C989